MGKKFNNRRQYKFYHHFLNHHLMEDLLTKDLVLLDINNQGLENSHSLQKLYQERECVAGGKANKCIELQILLRQFRILLLPYEKEFLLCICRKKGTTFSRHPSPCNKCTFKYNINLLGSPKSTIIQKQKNNEFMILIQRKRMVI